MNKIQKALLKSYEIHKYQTRKMNKAPYFVHLADTGKYLMYETENEDIISAGFLHDALEDTNYPEEELKKEFGDRVHALVKFCTEPGNNNDNTAEEQKRTWKMRKTNAITKLKNATEEELLVFCADKTANLLSIKEDLISGVDVWKKFNGTKEDVMWYYKEIEKALEPKLKNKRIFKIYQELMKIMK